MYRMCITSKRALLKAKRWCNVTNKAINHLPYYKSLICINTLWCNRHNLCFKVHQDTLHSGNLTWLLKSSMVYFVLLWDKAIWYKSLVLLQYYCSLYFSNWKYQSTPQKDTCIEYFEEKRMNQRIWEQESETDLQSMKVSEVPKGAETKPLHPGKNIMRWGTSRNSTSKLFEVASLMLQQKGEET